MECGHTNNKKPDRQSSIGLLWSHQGLSMSANTLVFNYHPQNNKQKSKQFAKIKPFSL